MQRLFPPLCKSISFKSRTSSSPYCFISAYTYLSTSSNHSNPSFLSETPKVSPLFQHLNQSPSSFASPFTFNRFFSSGYSPNGGNFKTCYRNEGVVRSFSSEPERESIQHDVVVVGAGPAGLSAAIRLKQLCRENGVDVSVCVVEKGPEVGAHIVSGNVFEPRGLDELLPEWKQEEAPISVPVTSDKFCFLTKDRAFSLPCPFDNRGNYVISLSQLISWMGIKAEELGVEIYPGFAVSEILYDANDNVIGIATNDMGIAKDGTKKDNLQRGVELRGHDSSFSAMTIAMTGTVNIIKQPCLNDHMCFIAEHPQTVVRVHKLAGHVTLLAEGCRGSLSEKLIKKYKLREKVHAQHQTYALGIKEVWEIDDSKHKPGAVLHTLGWHLNQETYGGSFLYRMEDRQISIGLVVALNYRNPYLNPCEKFQKLKHHPAIKPLLEGGTVLQYGARTLNEGGLQSIPYPVFPRGAIIGCSAGFLNVPKIKGTHTAMKSGMLAGEATFNALHAGSNLESYWETLRSSWIWEELHRARNYRLAFEYGLIPGMAISAFEHYMLKGRSPFTLKHGKPDHEATNGSGLVAQLHSPIEYPKPDGLLSFDVPTSLHRRNTNHEHDQPPHLHLRDPKIPKTVNLPEYAGPESRYYPARVYEYVLDETSRPQLQINAQNCLHCKACDIKDPKQNIEWTVPEGGGGHGYSVM